MMGAGVALDDKTKETIKALLSSGEAKNAIAKKVGVSWATVDKVSKEEPDKLESLREHKRSQFIDRLWNSMDSALKLADKRIELAIDANHKLDELYDLVGDAALETKKIFEIQRAIDSISSVPLGQISTFIGTIYDKHALMKGESTSNSTVTVKLEGELNKWAN